MPDEPKVAPQPVDAAAKTAQAMAKAEADAAARQADETVEGGKYITESGDVVDAEGKPFEEKPAEPKAAERDK
jgi:hypothetical protein